MNTHCQNALREATRLTRAGRLGAATEALRRVLGRFVPPRHHTPAPSPEPSGGGSMDAPPSEASQPGLDSAVIALPGPIGVAPVRAAASAGPGEFSAGTSTHSALTRPYKLYVPPEVHGRALPLVVMLHGCTQDPDDFAAGTHMNEHARERGFFVLYPAQVQAANPQRCWNWFKHSHQQRGHGEPALIAGLTLDVIRQYGIDARRVYIAGLSAGGAMAVLVAAAYPEIYAALGVHSGLPGGAASDLPSALALMKTGAARDRVARQPVPTIVFHGDQDRTVHPRNGEQLIAAVLGGGGAAPMAAHVEQGISHQGRRYTRSTHPGEVGRVQAEHWLVHGAGHAWSGGQAAGSYTDAKGPDATQEMLRFFFEHHR